MNPPRVRKRGSATSEGTRPAASGRARTLLGFAVFGAFWGTWGAALPGVRAHAGVSDGELGLALLCIGAGALVTMRLTGAILDRYGQRVLPVALAVFAVAAALPALATSGAVLAVALLAVGAASGVVDVSVNAEGVRSEAATGRPLMNLAHAAFSAAVVASSLLVGALRAAGAEVGVLLAGIAGLVLVVSLVIARLPAAEGRPSGGPAGGLRALLHVPAWLATLGGLTALAYFVENAWQSWSAVHLDATLGAPPALAALGPALFAAAATTGRLFGQAALQRVGDRVLVAIGAVVAAAGTFVAATAPYTAVALVGIALAGLGTSVCAPVLISLAGHHAGPEGRASAVSIVTTVAYLGFLVGPAAVGLAAEAFSLRAALVAVAGLALLLAVFARLAPAR